MITPVDTEYQPAPVNIPLTVVMPEIVDPCPGDAQPRLTYTEPRNNQATPTSNTTDEPQIEEHVPSIWPSGYYFGDSSEGPYSGIPQLRRVGVGVHHASPEKVPTYSWWQALPGEAQTVPRAEFTALLLVAINVHDSAAVDLFTDSKITSNTYYKGKHRSKFAANADLWVWLFQLIEQRGVSVYWMPSHTDTDPKKKKLAPSLMQK